MPADLPPTLFDTSRATVKDGHGWGAISEDQTAGRAWRQAQQPTTPRPAPVESASKKVADQQEKLTVFGYTSAEAEERQLQYLSGHPGNPICRRLDRYDTSRRPSLLKQTQEMQLACGPVVAVTFHLPASSSQLEIEQAHANYLTTVRGAWRAFSVLQYDCEGQPHAHATVPLRAIGATCPVCDGTWHRHSWRQHDGKTGRGWRCSGCELTWRVIRKPNSWNPERRDAERWAAYQAGPPMALAHQPEKLALANGLWWLMRDQRYRATGRKSVRLKITQQGTAETPSLALLTLRVLQAWSLAALHLQTLNILVQTQAAMLLQTLDVLVQTLTALLLALSCTAAPPYPLRRPGRTLHHPRAQRGLQRPRNARAGPAKREQGARSAPPCSLTTQQPAVLTTVPPPRAHRFPGLGADPPPRRHYANSITTALLYVLGGIHPPASCPSAAAGVSYTLDSQPHRLVPERSEPPPRARPINPRAGPASLLLS
ncbi:hypothetical protein [Deinococcus sonorensis]|uniref:Plasmid recombination enzyme n=2 Tax=Deinococcus sonorensis TaxID=309891 RepID=A0AAU7UBL3_9DEIO